MCEGVCCWCVLCVLWVCGCHGARAGLRNLQVYKYKSCPFPLHIFRKELGEGKENIFMIYAPQPGVSILSSRIRTDIYMASGTDIEIFRWLFTSEYKNKDFKTKQCWRCNLAFTADTFIFDVWKSKTSICMCNYSMKIFCIIKLHSLTQELTLSHCINIQHTTHCNWELKMFWDG